MRTFFLFFVSSLAAIAAGSSSASAQEVAPGVRAAGMGGAFTAVADDASAVYWNPAGLAAGSFFSLVLDRNAQDDASASLIAIGTPPLGLSYYRTVSGSPDDGRPSLLAHHAGVSVLQSLGGRLAVGATLRVVHGEVSAPNRGAVSSNKFDMDLGVMASGAVGKIGLTVHNLTAPSFDGPVSVTLDRRVRAGISVNTSRSSLVDVDVDLAGDTRQAAAGGEWHPVRAGWVRGGFRWTTSGADRHPTASLGGSYVIYGSTMADAQVSFGSGEDRNGWGVGLRFIF